MPRGIGTYGSKRGRPKKKKKYGAGGSTSLANMRRASAYQMGGTVKNMTLEKFRHGGMCKRK